MFDSNTRSAECWRCSAGVGAKGGRKRTKWRFQPARAHTMNTSSRARILLIEDEAKTARAVLNSLKAEGFAPVWVETGEDGFFVLSSQHFDAGVLDWMLPGRSGLEVLKTVRAKDSKTPVLLLTARDALEDRGAGLDSGADDYRFKPFALAESASRPRAPLRRATAGSPAEEKHTYLRV